MIPSNKQSAVDNALQQAFQTTEISEITQLAGGLSPSPVFKIIVKGQPYVLKLDSALSFPNLEIAAMAGIAPPVYYLDAAEGLVISRFVENQPLRLVYSSDDMLLGELGSLIRSVHEMPAFPKSEDLLEKVENLIGQLKGTPFYAKSVFEDFFEYFDIIGRHYPWDDKDRVSSHNDLNPNNIICDGTRLWIVDWDAAFLNDRYVDLAITANFFVRNEEQERQLLFAYFGPGLNTYHASRLFIMRQICRLVYAAMLLKLAYNTDTTLSINDPELKTLSMQEVGARMGAGKLSLGSVKGQVLIGKALIQEALKDMRGPRFGAAINILHEVSF